jgi:FtsP/CotA-like multicopper oxidase with cupredoxin domain
VPTQIWGYNGSFPGPTIVSRSGRATVVRHRNQLPVPTVVHLHGGHTPAASDGNPTDLLLPEAAAGNPHHHSGHADPHASIATGSRDHLYPMRQRAATLWYHDHRMDFTVAPAERFDLDPTRADATPRLGDVEVWQFTSDFHHPVHLHLATFQILRRNAGRPGPYDAGWKDTVDLRPAEQVSVITRFTDYPGRYVLHCHNLEHEDMAMMATVHVG